MKKCIISMSVSLLIFIGCSGKPSVSKAKKSLENELKTKYGQSVKLVSFHKTNATQGELLGVKFYRMEYKYKIECSSYVPIKELDRLSVKDIMTLEEYIKKQNGPYVELPENISLGYGALWAIENAYNEKRSLFLCKPGESKEFDGETQFFLRENGWEEGGLLDK